jgi:hypothetical protein
MGYKQRNEITSHARSGYYLLLLWFCRNDFVFKENLTFLLCRLFSQLFIGSIHELYYKNQLYRTLLQWHRNNWLRWPKNFSPRHMGGGHFYGLTVIRVSVYFFSLSLEAMCILVM